MNRILLIDDEPAIRKLLAEILGYEGFSVMTAGSAAEAAACLARETFDLVLTDLRMETPTAGFDVVRAANACVPRPAIVILTAFPVAPAEWRQSGADLLCVKGCDMRTLSRTLHEVLAHHQNLDVTAQQRSA